MPLATGGEAAALTALLTGRFISLHTAIPTGAGEVSGGGYARQSGGTFTQAGNNPMSASNAANIEFPVATASWGTITYVGIYSAVTGGTLIAYQALSVSKVIATDDVFRFKAGQLSMTAD